MVFRECARGGACTNGSSVCQEPCVCVAGRGGVALLAWCFFVLARGVVGLQSLLCAAPAGGAPIFLDV
jgi:hypothetical protein